MTPFITEGKGIQRLGEGLWGDLDERKYAVDSLSARKWKLKVYNEQSFTTLTTKLVKISH